MGYHKRYSPDTLPSRFEIRRRSLSAVRWSSALTFLTSAFILFVRVLSRFLTWLWSLPARCCSPAHTICISLELLFHTTVPIRRWTSCRTLETKASRSAVCVVAVVLAFWQSTSGCCLRITNCYMYWRPQIYKLTICFVDKNVSTMVSKAQISTLQKFWYLLPTLADSPRSLVFAITFMS